MSDINKKNIKELGWAFGRFVRDHAYDDGWTEEQREKLDELFDRMDPKQLGRFALGVKDFVDGEDGQAALDKSMAGQNNAAFISGLFGHESRVEATAVGPYWALHMGLVGSFYSEPRQGTILKRRRSGKWERLHVEHEGVHAGLCWDRSRDDYHSVSVCVFGKGDAGHRAAETWVRGDNPVVSYQLQEFLNP